MLLTVKTHLIYSARQPCDLLLQIESVQDDTQRCEEVNFLAHPKVDWTCVPGEENIGQRRWGRVEQMFDCTYSAEVRITRPESKIENLQSSPKADLPSDVIKFLMPSRYCHPEEFLEFVACQFGDLSGGKLIASMAQWINQTFTYDINASNASTSASESFKSQAGVCRDYAHVLTSMARAVGIPARFVSAYAPDVSPQDFHAVVEVYLEGVWHLIDATGMSRAPEIVRIGVGRDAADVSFMTSYGWMSLIKQSVEVSRV